MKTKNKIMNFKEYINEGKMEKYCVDTMLNEVLMMLESIISGNIVEDCDGGKNALIDAQTKIEEAKVIFSRCASTDVVKQGDATDEINNIDNIIPEDENDEESSINGLGTTDLQTAKDLEGMRSDNTETEEEDEEEENI